jgi:DNA-binding NtrC family response regulator/tetratricopeptide (TPR) repeat protein
VIRKLGSGGGGAVYLARDLLDGEREVALKVSHHQVAPEDVLREFRVLRQLRHPAIARALDFGRLPESGATYMTLEYVAGAALDAEAPRLRRAWLAGERRPLVAVFLQIASALGHLHRKGLVHLDLKPANVIFADGRIKLIDFGIFQSIAHQDARRPRGTACYMAPESFDGGPLDARADLYSLGVTLAKTATGQLPIRGRSVEEVADQHRRAAPLLPAGLDAGLEALIRSLLAKSPRQRPQSADDVCRALRALAPAAEAELPRLGAAEPDFIGRKRALEGFFAWLDRLRRGDGPRLVAIEGEAGAGKSRFLDACITELLGLGIDVLPLSVARSRGQRGLRRLVEAVRLRYPAPSRDAERDRSLFAALGIDGEAAGPRSLARLDLEQIRARLFSDVSSFLAERLPNPCVIAIDDLHRSDAEFLDFLARCLEGRLAAPPPPGLGFAATARPGLALPEAAEAASDRVGLERFRRRETLAILNDLEPDLDPRKREALARASRGNPGLLAHLLRRSLPEDRLASAEPLDLGALLRERIVELGPEARRVLALLDLLGRPASREWLRELGRLDEAELARALEALERDGVLGGNRHAYFLSKEIPDGLLRELLGEDEIRRLHLRIGRRLLGAAGEEYAAAVHVLRGGKLGQGLRAARQAMAALRRGGRLEEALALATEASERARGRPEAREFGEARGDFLEKCGQFDEAFRAFDALLREAPFASSDRIRLLRKRGGVEQRRGSNDAARADFEEALGLLEAHDDLEEHLHLLNELSALYLYCSEFPRATSFANRGLEMLRSPRAARLRPDARALHALNFHSVAGHILLRQFEYERSVEEFEKGLDYSERIDSLPDTAIILNNLGIAYHQASRLREALRVYKRATELARRMGDETALFSIQCNVSGIRARLGEMRQAMAILDEVEAMPHARRSRRARLFYLHSRGLVDRLLLRDARGTWEESIRLADELPDPIFSAYGRVYLLENEIQFGRWANARATAAQIEGRTAEDARLDRALALRVAWLEAHCGREEVARARLHQAIDALPFSEEPGWRPAHVDLWDNVLAATTLIELAEWERAERRLRILKRAFDRLRQPTGSLECSLLLAELSLRRRRGDEAERHLKEARRAFSLHDSNLGSRAGLAKLSFLEARLALVGGGGRAAAAGEARGEALAPGSPTALAEGTWLGEAVAVAAGEPGAQTRLEAARDRFLAGLEAGDRRAYRARDHHLRLGIVGSGRGDLDADQAVRERQTHARLEALHRLLRFDDPRRALEYLVDAAGARRGAVFFADARPSFGSRGWKKGTLERLRAAALRAPDGRSGKGLSTAVSLPKSGARAALYLELAQEPDEAGIEGLLSFAQTAAALLARVLEGPHRAGQPSKETTPSVHREATKTLLHTANLLASGAKEWCVSPRMHAVLTLILRTRDSDLPVLITGESGVGKDFCARLIHAMSRRRDRPFVGQDLSAIPESLVEADLFGHEAGAFTGAQRNRRGYLLSADGGTFYLDNVDTLSLEMQGKLLKLLERSELRPLGARSTVKLNVRFVASSQRDLKDLSARGEFRNDLYFRLAGICIALPPLRERPEDIPHLLEQFRKQIPGGGPALAPSAVEALQSHHWPGNVRELESVFRRLALTCEEPVGGDEVRKVLGLEEAGTTFPRWLFEGRGYADLLQDLKREYLLYLFDRFQGDLDAIARELGTTKRNVYQRFSQAGLRPVDLRARG